MNTLWSPISVTPPPPAVPRWIVTNSRNTLRSPIDEARRLAVILQILRDQADRGEREDLVAVADLGRAVDDRRGADAAVASDAHVIADDRVRADDRAGADRRARMHDRASRSDLRPDAVGVVATAPSAAPPPPRCCRRYRRPHARARAAPAPRPHRDFEPQPVARARPAAGTWRCPRRADRRTPASVPLVRRATAESWQPARASRS